MTVCLAGSEQALHVKNVLEEPQEHGLSEGRWYAVDADEALLEGHSVHTLAGVFGCSLQDLHVLQRAFESNGLVSRGTPLGGKASQLSIQLGHEIFKPGDRVWNGKRYTWIAFGKEPLYSPNQQLTNTSGHVPQPLRTKLLAAALMPHLQRALPSTPPTVETGPDHTRGNGDCAHAAASDADAADPAGDGEPSDAALDRLAQAQRMARNKVVRARELHARALETLQQRAREAEAAEAEAACATCAYVELAAARAVAPHAAAYAEHASVCSDTGGGGGDGGGGGGGGGGLGGGGLGGGGLGGGGGSGGGGGGGRGGSGGGGDGGGGSDEADDEEGDEEGDEESDAEEDEEDVEIEAGDEDLSSEGSEESEDED